MERDVINDRHCAGHLEKIQKNQSREWKKKNCIWTLLRYFSALATTPYSYYRRIPALKLHLPSGYERPRYVGHSTGIHLSSEHTVELSPNCADIG